MPSLKREPKSEPSEDRSVKSRLKDPPVTASGTIKRPTPSSSTESGSGTAVRSVKQKPSRPTMGVKEFYACLEKTDEEGAKSMAEMQLDYDKLCGQLLQLMSQVKDSNGALVEDPAKWLQRARDLLMHLRRTNRETHFSNHRLNEKLIEERARVDSKYLQLQNIIHEIQHIQKEVQRCLQFRSADEDFDLVSVDDFYRDAPPEIAKPDLTKVDEHELRLARLNWELQQRKSLMQQLGGRESQIADLCSDIKERTDLIANFKPQVDRVLESTKPLQESLNVKYELADRHDQLARLLPNALYHLYVQTKAYKEMTDDSGTEDNPSDSHNAGAHSSTIAAHPPSGRSSAIDTAQMPPPLPVRQSGNRSRSRTPVTGKKDKRGHRSSSRSHGKSSSSSKVNGATKPTSDVSLEPIDADTLNVIGEHPLTVKITMDISDLNGYIVLTFTYLMELSTVTVRAQLFEHDVELKSSGCALSPTELLSGLTIDHDVYDSGLQCHYAVGQQKLYHNNIDFTSLIGVLGCTYGWAQKLCGQRYNEPTRLTSSSSEATSDREKSCDFLQKCLSAVVSRVKARLPLDRVLKSFASSRLPVLNANACVALGLSSAEETQDYLPKWTGWKRVPVDELKALDNAAELVRSTAASAWYFVATFSTTIGQLNCYVVLPHNYPRQPSLCALQLLNPENDLQADSSNNDSLKTLETKLNLDLGTQFIKDVQMLAVQLCAVMQSLEGIIVIEDAPMDADDGNTPVNNDGKSDQ